MAASSSSSVVPFQPDFGKNFVDIDSTITWLRKNGLLLWSLHCEGCKRPMKESKKEDLEDKRVWECCRMQRSIRSNSFFFKSPLNLSIAAYLIFYFCNDVPAYVSNRLLGPSVSYKSILSWYYKLRDVCSKRLISSPLVFKSEEVALLTGEDTIEIDESLFGKKAKCGRGTSCQKYSVFGIVEKRGKRCVLHLVKDRKRSTLLPIIQRHVDPTCHIHHDGFAAYDSLATEGYQHSVVNHNVEFSTADGIHTNTIEGLWGLVKQRISRMHGVPSLNSLAALLDEFSYRQIYSREGSIWDRMTEDIREFFSSK